MLTGCIVNRDASRLTRAAIKQFRVLSRPVSPERFSEIVNEIWREKHGIQLRDRPRPGKRVKCDPGFKYCNGCERILPIASFSVDRSRRSGRNNRCRNCVKADWKRVNHERCISCGGWCVGQVCRRCYRLNIIVRDAEHEALSLMPRMIAEGRKELDEFMRSLGANRKLSPQRRLQKLVERLASGS